jgi:GNAT superfamily N-acetyltransferase
MGMPRLISIHTPEEAARFPGPQLPAFDVESIARHGVDEHLILLDDDGAPIARASLWWKDVPVLPKQRLGVVGHYASRGAEPAAAILAGACQRLREHGCTLAVGPMDGNTWRRYRWLTERGSEAPFLLEPDNPNDWPGQWEAAGFGSLASYFSALNTDLAYEDAQVGRAGERLHREGVRIRTLNPERFEDELRLIYGLSIGSFGSNYLYTPLPEEAFLAQYLAVRERTRPELVLLAELEGQPVGFVFCIPDWLRGPATDTVIVKTLAVLPGRRSAGLGTWLLARAQMVARELGYRRVIHALMHESNNSLNLSARYAKIFRRYTLYSHAL